MKLALRRAVCIAALPVACVCAMAYRIWTLNKRLVPYLRADLADEVAMFRQMWKGRA